MIMILITDNLHNLVFWKHFWERPDISYLKCFFTDTQFRFSLKQNCVVSYEQNVSRKTEEPVCGGDKIFFFFSAF